MNFDVCRSARPTEVRVDRQKHAVRLGGDSSQGFRFVVAV